MTLDPLDGGATTSRQIKPKIVAEKSGSTWPNDALMREFEWLIDVDLHTFPA